MEIIEQTDSNKCLWCKYGAINHYEKKIYCHKDEQFHDKNDSCDKWRYGF